MMNRAASIVLAVAIAAPVLADDSLPSLAVMDVRAGEGVSPDVARFVTSTVARTAADTEAFRVISGEDIRALLTLEMQKQMCGAGSDACLAEIGGALGAEYLISGSLQRIGEATSLDLSLLDVRAAKGLSRVGRRLEGGEQSLFDVVPNATVELLAKALEGRQGTLVVSVSEAGAAVKIDGRIVGAAPLGPQTLAAGVHLLEVEKKGFITQQEQVKVKADGTTARSVALVPSPDFLEAYESSATKMRIGAWISVGVLAAGAGAGLFFNGQAERIHQDFTRQKDAYVSEGPDAPVFADLETLASQGKNAQARAYVGFGLAGAAGLSALYFFVAGDDPGRYSQYQVAAAPLPGGGIVAAFVAF